MAAEMGGELDRALDEMRLARVDRVPPGLETVAGRLQIHCLLIGWARRRGRRGGPEAVGDEATTESPCTSGPSRGGWPASRPISSRSDGPRWTCLLSNSRDEFVRRTLVASLLASTGRRDEVHRLVEGRGGAPDDGRADQYPRRGARRRRPRPVRGRRPRRGTRGTPRRRRRGRARRQPDPGSAPAPVPADRLRARPRAARPLGRRHARPRRTTRRGR